MIVVGAFAGWMAERMNCNHDIFENLTGGFVGAIIGNQVARFSA